MWRTVVEYGRLRGRQQNRTTSQDWIKEQWLNGNQFFGDKKHFGGEFVTFQG